VLEALRTRAGALAAGASVATAFLGGLGRHDAGRSARCSDLDCRRTLRRCDPALASGHDSPGQLGFLAPPAPLDHGLPRAWAAGFSRDLPQDDRVLQRQLLRRERTSTAPVVQSGFRR